VAYCPLQKTRNDAHGSRQVKVQSLFSDYRIQSNANNEITFLISPEALLLALRSAWNPASLDSTPETVMKLAKKNDQAVLSFDISGSMSSGRMVRVGHDVRIEVMKPSDVNKLTEPMCPEPDVRLSHRIQEPDRTLNGPLGQVHILLPPLQKLRTIVERLRPLSDVIAVRCNNNGKLQISVQTDSVSVDTQWSGCTNPKMGAFSLLIVTTLLSHQFLT
jgi:HUS1 checkpoint protein